MSTDFVEQVRADVKTYDASFFRYGSRNELPWQLFNQLDHIAVTLENIKRFGEVVKNLGQTAVCSMPAETQDGRFAYRFLLGSPLKMYSGRVGWIEVQEPRKPRPALRVDYAQFIVESRTDIKSAFWGRDLKFDEEFGVDIPAISVPIDKAGRQIRFAEEPIADIAETAEL